MTRGRAIAISPASTDQIVARKDAEIDLLKQELDNLNTESAAMAADYRDRLIKQINEVERLKKAVVQSTTMMNAIKRDYERQIAQLKLQHAAILKKLTEGKAHE